MVGLSLPILVAVFTLQCISAAIRREPGRLGQAALGALLGTAGVPLAVGVIASCGKLVDEISTGILGKAATADGIKRMTDITGFLTAGTAGGILLLAVQLGLLAMFSLYFVMLVREVALVAFVVFAPVAMASWTWSATRHWLRRWVEIVGALLFSKIAMALVFTLGLSAVGVSGQGNASNLGTFFAGILLVGMAAFAPLATYSFIHWAGDQGHAMTRVFQEGSAGVEKGKEELERLQEWVAAGLTGSDEDEPSPVVGDGDTPDDESASGGRDESIERSDSVTSTVDGEGQSTSTPDVAVQPSAATPATAGEDSGPAGGATGSAGQASGQGG
ncbi:hypothetical protein [Kribbella sp. VKM Ac-2571]|uniref:hypothetical protein n=1 Tax=Kribbella sp. VKM Ac-2571 TaxID=2512222 RepID=UPI001061A8BB|nr:hypothetical protein [Kribbella sp. VKM Ac-2571]